MYIGTIKVTWKLYLKDSKIFPLNTLGSALSLYHLNDFNITSRITAFPTFNICLYQS